MSVRLRCTNVECKWIYYTGRLFYHFPEYGRYHTVCPRG